MMNVVVVINCFFFLFVFLWWWIMWRKDEEEEVLGLISTSTTTMAAVNHSNTCANIITSLYEFRCNNTPWKNLIVGRIPALVSTRSCHCLPNKADLYAANCISSQFPWSWPYWGLFVWWLYLWYTSCSIVFLGLFRSMWWKGRWYV